MVKYAIIGLDGPDPAKRLAVREAHLAYMSELKTSGNFVFGGAQLDEAGAMVGSIIILQFETKEGLDLYMQTDPYFGTGVFQTYTVREFRQANL